MAKCLVLITVAHVDLDGWRLAVCGVWCAWPAMEHGGGKGSSQSKGERRDRPRGGSLTRV